MTDRYSIVVTTINAPTDALRALAAGAEQLDASVVVIGDDKTPADFHLDNTVYLGIDAQRALDFDYARTAPTRHYARKNIGYLVAIAAGATVIIETDDDNAPIEGFWDERTRHVSAETITDPRWVNVYKYFTPTLIWPRGLPLDVVRQEQPEPAAATLTDCPIQQGLADGDPDVDAIYRLVFPLPLDFDKRAPIALKDAWCPFNSQNTTFWADAFALLYLPYHCSFRMTDIWRSFVAQRIAYANGWSILFHNATVYQDRNEHNLSRDFEQEVDGYLNNDSIKRHLLALDLPLGVENIPAAVRLCYAELCRLELVGAQELDLLDLWLADLATATAAGQKATGQGIAG